MAFHLLLTNDEAAEVRECLGAIVLDLGTVDIEPEDQPRLDRLHAVLQRLEATMRDEVQP